MGWREEHRRVKMPDGRELIGASFRGVPFFVESGQRTGGRRTVTKEFPKRDDPYIEDMGRKARTYPVSGYVLGDDYMTQRDLLLDALENTAGAGTLIHPYHGTLQAICVNLTVGESSQDGGIATFSIEFAETSPAVPPPVASPDHNAAVDEAADASQTAAEAGFVAEYDVDDEPSFALSSLAEELEAAGDKIYEKLAPIATTTAELAALNATTIVLTSQATSLIREPSDMFAALTNVWESLVDTFAAAPRDVLLALLEVYDSLGGIPDALGTTATRVLERANQAAMTAALQRSVLHEASKRAPRVTYDSLEAATEDSSALIDLIDDQLAVADDATFARLESLRAAVAAAVPGDQVLAHIVEVERPVATPSLLVSYQLYGSVEQEADILARNFERYPWIMSGTLQVLSDEE